MAQLTDVLRKIKQFILANKPLVIIVTGVVFVIILFVIALLPKNKYSDLALIEQPLYFYENKKVNISPEIYKDFKTPKKGLEIYRINSDNQNIKVEGILTRLNVASPTKNVFGENIAYTWSNKKGDNVQYDVKSQTMSLQLSDSFVVFPSLASPSDDQLRDSFKEFAKKYINSEYEYVDIEVERRTSDIIISSRRLVNGIPLQRPGIIKNYDYILLDTQFKLKSLRFNLLTIQEQPVNKLKIISPVQLSSVVSNPNYPKEITDGIVKGLDGGKKITDVGTRPDYIQGDDRLDVPNPAVYKAKDIELVYFYSNVDQQFLTPVYRMNLDSSIVYKGSTYTIDSVINASAIDPDFVYIPSNIVYAD